MSNKVVKNNNEQEQKKDLGVQEENTEETKEEVKEQEKPVETPAPVPEEKLPLTKKERWFAKNADKLDDGLDKAVKVGKKVGKLVIGGVLLVGAGILIHKGLSDDEQTIDVDDVKVSDPTPEPEKEEAVYGEF